jgi:hypothetical protein
MLVASVAAVEPVRCGGYACVQQRIWVALSPPWVKNNNYCANLATIIHYIWACPSLRSGRHIPGFASLGASHPFGPYMRLTQTLTSRGKTHKKAPVNYNLVGTGRDLSLRTRGGRRARGQAGGQVATCPYVNPIILKIVFRLPREVHGGPP